MSADNGVVVPLMRGCHCIWGLPRRAVHSLGIADGTVSATCANFGAQAQGKWHSSSRRVEPHLIFWCAPQNQRPPSPPPSAARCAAPRSPRSSSGPAFLFGGAGSYVRVAAPRIYACSSRTSYGVTPARRTTRRLRFRRVRRALLAQTYRRADLLPSRIVTYGRRPSRTIALPLALRAVFFYVLLIFFCFRFFLLATTGASPF